MKKRFLFFIFTISVIVFGLCSCTNKDYQAKKEENNSSFMQGVYLSKYEFVNGDFKEISAFGINTDYDKFDAYNKTDNKKFSVYFDDNKQSLNYTINYDINKNDMEYFLPCLVVKDLNGNLSAKMLSQSVYVHSGIVHSQTLSLEVKSNYLAANNLCEILNIKLNFI